METESQPMRYLVTGSSGFIASRVAKRLLEQGHHVVGIDNMNNYYAVELKEHRNSWLASERFEFVQGDLENIEVLNDIFARHKFDAVINLAARAGVRYSMTNPHVYMTTNAMGSLNLLEQMRQHGIKKYVLASTSSLYAGQEMPFDESLAVNTPISPYAASKKSAEMMAHAYHHLYETDVSICRYFTVYGPAGRPDMCIYRFIKWIDEGTPIELFGDGEQARDFTYVDDIAAGTIAAIKPIGFEVINLGGGGTPVSLNTIIAKLEEMLGKKAKLEYKTFHKADIKVTSANISKAKRLLGWEPVVELDQGLQACVDWHRENDGWVKDLPLP